MGDLLSAMRANPLIPTSHWEPRCELCRLRNTHPEEYGWLTRQLLGMADGGGELLTQEQLAAELERRTGLSITQAQVSHHKTRHVDPGLADAVESLTGHLVLLDFCAGMTPSELAVAYAKLALVKTGQLLQEAEGAKSAAPLAAAVTGLAGVLQRADRDAAETDLAEVEARLAQMREQASTGDYQHQFAEWVRQHYPELAPILADPEALTRLLAQVKGAPVGAPDA